MYALQRSAAAGLALAQFAVRAGERVAISGEMLAAPAGTALEVHVAVETLDGSGDTQRLTHFNDYAGYKASNPVVSDDGKFIAFQMAKTKEPAGVGHGIFLYDIAKAGQ